MTGKRLLVALGLFNALMQTGYCQGGNLKTAPVHEVAARMEGDPLRHLPAHIEVLTLFGERADISPDNTHVAFMAKAFGDAMVIDLASRSITCLTCTIPAAAYLRVMHLSNGDYLLTGPDHFENPQVSKTRDSELWYLGRAPGAKPVKLGIKASAGLAVSKQSMRIVFTRIRANASQELVSAELDLSGPVPSVVREQVLLGNTDTTCILEAQDFYDHDARITFFCYNPGGAVAVRGLNLKTGAVTSFTNDAGGFNEPEGIFPGGGYTAVESDRQCAWLGGNRGSQNVDIWKLKLDGTGKNFQRLTHFNDYAGGKAANPVVATNNRFMAFQAAKATDPPGVGHGLLLYWFNK